METTEPIVASGQYLRVAGDNRRRKERVIEKLGMHCCHCGKETLMLPVGEINNANNATSLEHIIPRIHLTTHEKNTMCNLAIACAKCNSKRGLKFTASIMQVIDSFPIDRKKQLLEFALKQEQKVDIRLYTNYITESIKKSSPAPLSFNIMDVCISQFLRKYEEPRPNTWTWFWSLFKEPMEA